MKRLHIYKRLFHYVLQYRYKLVLLTFISLAGVVFEVAKPLPVKLVIDNVLSNHRLPRIIYFLFGDAAWLQNKHYLLFAAVGLLTATIIASAIISFIVFTRTISLAQQLVYDLSVDFFSKLQRMSLSFYTKNQVGDLLERMTGDVFVVYFLVAQIVLPVFTSIICLVGMFYVMAKIDLLLACIAFSVVPLLGLTLAFFAKPMNDTTTEQYHMQGQLSAFAQQSLVSMKIIQAFGRESYMAERFQMHARTFSTAFKVANRVSMTYNQVSQLLTALASVVVIGVGSFRVLHGVVSTGDLFVFLGYITALYGPVNSVASAIGTAVSLGARGKRIFDIIDSDEIVQEKVHPVVLTRIKGDIEFRNVTFGYGNEQKDTVVIDNISFKVSPGQIVAIVGPTGAGKTSIISLLSRFYDPWKGAIYLDGEDIKELELHSLRKNIALVLQDSLLFPMTIGENISFGNPEASFEQVVEAAKMAQVHEFIIKQRLGYDTMVSENGSSLSGGQRQRIAIARAFLKDTSILILDEPTSALDSLTEAKIFKELSLFAKGKTVFLISHRLSALKHADQIIIIKDGIIAEHGTHQSLIAEDKVYASLYKQQHLA